MKKLLLTLSVIAGLLSNAFAIDLISVATNGKSNENSLGVKTLNNQEMSEIVGGMTLKHNFFKQYGVVDNSGHGGKIWLEGEIDKGTKCWFTIPK